ncbi:unnamed protein product [Symbiodinium microadriaticum]|nr:unnamed protein product [Symbiodinium microadriaticum]
MKVLHHTLTVMTGHGLDAYVVPAPPDIMQTPETLTFAAKPERRMIRAVEDEEGCQTKAWNYLAEVAGLRCLVEPELCHPLWNAFKRSVRYAGLETSVLKLTVLCNHSHGAFLSGERYHTWQEIVGDFLAAQAHDFFLDVVESLAFDRGESYDPDQVPDRFREWMDSPAIARRGLPVSVVEFAWAVLTAGESTAGVGLELCDQKPEEGIVVKPGVTSPEPAAKEFRTPTDKIRGPPDTPPSAPARIPRYRVFQRSLLRRTLPPLWSWLGKIVWTEKIKRKVKNKMWFGMNKAFAALIDEWTVQEVAGNAMLRVEEKYDETVNSDDDGEADDQEPAEEEPARTGSWWETCGEILLKVHSSALLKRLGVAPRLGAEAAPLDKAWVKQEQELLQMVYSFSTYLASNVAWSQLMFKYTLPHGIACLASRGRNEREDATLLLEEMVLTLRKALEPKHSGNVGLQEILQDLAWHRQAFSAEVMAMLLKSDFDCHDEDLRSVAVELYSGSSTTKDCIESTFGHLRDAVTRSTKNARPLSNWSGCMHKHASIQPRGASLRYVRRTRIGPSLQQVPNPIG